MKGSLLSLTQRIALPLLLALALAGPTWAQPTEYKLTASDGAVADRFGASVSLSGDRALVGAYLDDDQGDASGAAYVYERQGDDSWIEVDKLTASDGGPDDIFGWSVALSGDRAIVGAPADSGPVVDAGSAYVYERQGDGTWLEAARLIASDGATFDFFGISVSLLDDRAIVGAYLDDDQGTSSGSVYVFERQGDESWIEVTKLSASDGAASDLFGFSVSLSRDRALIGAHFDDDQGDASGSAYVFERQGDGSWLEVAKLTASDGVTEDLFGRSVSLSENRALIGAFGEPGSNYNGSAYVFERQGDGSWIEIDKLTASDGAPRDRFGYSVSLSGDRAVIGAYEDDDIGENSGSVYVYERQQDGTWLEVRKLTASDASPEDWFGISVSLSGDRTIVGTIFDDDQGDDSGSAYVYDNPGTIPTAVEMTTDLPQVYLLSALYPNPFNPQTQFSLTIAEPQQVRIEVVDALGRCAAILHEGHLAGRGTYDFSFEASSLPSGVYLLRVTGETFATTRTMTLLK